MQLTREDLIEIRTLLSIGWKPTEIFAHRVNNKYRRERPWKRTAVFNACKKIENQRGSIERRHGSGRPKSARTEENEELVEEALLSADDEPGTHLSLRKAARKIGMSLKNFLFSLEISQTSVRRIAKSKGIKAKKKVRVHKIPIPKRRIESNEERRVRLAKDLLEMCDPEQDDLVKKGIFTDESNFQLYGPVSNQNRRVYSKGKKSTFPLTGFC